MREKSFYLLALIVVIVSLSYLSLQKIEPFESFSLRFNDSNFDLQDKEPNKNIVFVAVDEPSINKYGRWPWDRKILAKGIRKLSEADIVLTDMIFSETTSKKADSMLGDSIAALNASVCGFFLRDISTQQEDENSLELLEDSALDMLQSQIAQHSNPHFVSAPFAEINIFDILQNCTMSGSFSTLAQSDKLFRSYPIGVYYAQTLFPSLGVQALRLKFNSDIKRLDTNRVLLDKHEIYLNDRGFVRLNFYKREQYNIVSFLDVMEGKITPEYFKNKIVILGITEVGSGDVVSTPIGFLYGPLLHYTFISNVLQNHLIIEPKYVSLIVSLLLTFIPLLLLFFTKKIITRVIINALVYLLVYIVVKALFVYEMVYIDLFFPLLAISLSAIVMESLAFSNHERRSRFVRDAFSSYLSEDLLHELTKNPKALTLGGEKKELSILFSDIRDFTALSESMDPADLVQLLNRYFTPMTKSVLKCNGMLDKYIGDALMAFYNAPLDVKNHADQACWSALEMMRELALLNKELQKENKAPLLIGIGINTAEVVVGNMGSDNRFNYTVMGDGVNLASRVESLSKRYGVSIIITEFTLAKLEADFVCRKLESVVVKGKEKAVLLYELMPDTQESRELKTSYDSALALYIKGDLKNARINFEKIVRCYKDKPSQYLLHCIKEGMAWGTQIMQEK